MRASTVVATEQGLKARDARLLSGGYPSDAVLERDPAQVLLGAVLAKQLGVDDQPGSNQLLVNGRVNTVSGLLQDGGDRSILSTTVTMSPVTANYLNLMPENRLVIVRVSPGAAERVAEVLPEFIDPAHVDEISLGVAPSPAKLREQLLSGTRALVIVIAAVMSGATLFGIVTTMQIAAWERRREIGLNRALGSSRAAIALGFLTESMMLGTLGTFVGYLLGILFGASISTAAGWILCVPTWTLIVPIAGAIAGAAAGAWPAWGATR
ncbi:MAG: FtsX-like permease family protein, partial [Actinobacteria bacterium]|nr:FtsX-like permease family protein [Actinomycetota bacterium]